MMKDARIQGHLLNVEKKDALKKVSDQLAYGISMHRGVNPKAVRSINPLPSNSSFLIVIETMCGLLRWAESPLLNPATPSCPRPLETKALSLPRSSMVCG